MTVPCLDDLAEGAERGLDTCGRARATLRIAIQIALTPLFEVNPRQDRRLMRRDVFDESVPLIFRRYNAPRWKRRWCFVTSWSAPADRSKQHPTIHQCRMNAGKEARGHRAPRMGDQRYLLDVLVRQDKAHCGLHLLRCIIRCAQGGIVGCWLIHLRIPVRMTEAVEVKSPDVEACRAQCVAPGFPVKSMRNRERRWKRRAVHVEDHAARPSVCFC